MTTFTQHISAPPLTRKTAESFDESYRRTRHQPSSLRVGSAAHHALHVGLVSHYQPSYRALYANTFAKGTRPVDWLLGPVSPKAATCASSTSLTPEHRGSAASLAGAFIGGVESVICELLLMVTAATKGLLAGTGYCLGAVLDALVDFGFYSARREHNQNIINQLTPHMQPEDAAALKACGLGLKLPFDPFGLKKVPSGDAEVKLPTDPKKYDEFFAKHDMIAPGVSYASTQTALQDDAKIPALTQWIWLGNPMPAKYQSDLQSFIDNNPTHGRVIWTNVPADKLNTPAGESMRSFCEKNAIRLVPVDGLMQEVVKSGLYNSYQERHLQRQYGGCSDILRIVALKMLGGTYIDADRTCEVPIDTFGVPESTPLRNNDLVLYGENDRDVVAINDFLMSTPNHPFLDVMVKTMKYSNARGVKALNEMFDLEDSAVLSNTGPMALDRAYQTWKRLNHGADGTRMLNHFNLGDLDNDESFSIRKNEIAWSRTKHKKLAPSVIDELESGQDLQRRVTCILDDWRAFGELKLVKYEGEDLPATLSLLAKTLAEANKVPMPSSDASTDQGNAPVA